MNERVTRSRAGSGQVGLLLSLLLAVVLMAACGRGNEGTPGADQAADNVAVTQPTLICSQECADRGQCGETPDRGKVVLLSIDRPALAPEQHELAIPVDTVVEIRGQEQHTIVEDVTGREFPLIFHRVFIPQRNTEAWVAQWCVLIPGQ